MGLAFGASVLVFLLSFILRCTCFKLLANEDFVPILPGDSITILCQADVVLSSCQVMEFETSTFYELSKGAHTAPTSSYRYYGTGLQHGQCGLFIPQTETAHFYKVYVCRARTSGANWAYATTAVVAVDVTTMIFPVECGPEVRYVDTGSDVIFLYTAADAIKVCNFKWQGQETWVPKGAELEYTIDDSKIDEGLCQLTLHRVVDTSSGFVIAMIEAQKLVTTTKNENKVKAMPIKVCVTTLIVKAAPATPQLKLQECIGGTEPSCSAGPGRPTPTITWHRGNVVIRRDEDNEADTGRWVWEYEPRSTTQNLNKRLTMENDGHDITCTVHHIALAPNGTLQTRLPMPKVDALSNVFLFIVYLMIGIGTVLLAVAITVAMLIVYKYTQRTWCFIDLPKW